jgi:hypothetical protein
LVLTLFSIIPTFSSSENDYNPWLDINGDGWIDGGDIIQEARAFGTSGDATRPVIVSGYGWNSTTSTIMIPPQQEGTLNITTAGYRQVTVGFASFNAQVETEFLLNTRYAVMDSFDVGVSTNANCMWMEPKWIDPSTSAGTRFNVTVWLNVTTDNVFGYQVALLYNRTQLECTRANFTDDFMDSPPSGLQNSLRIDTSELGNGSIIAFQSCKGDEFITTPKCGTLIWIEFQVISTPLTSNIDISTEYPLKTWVQDPNLMVIPMSVHDALVSIGSTFDVYKTYTVIGSVLTIKYSNPNNYAIPLLIETYTTA